MLGWQLGKDSPPLLHDLVIGAGNAHVGATGLNCAKLLMTLADADPTILPAVLIAVGCELLFLINFIHLFVKQFRPFQMLRF